MTRLSRRLFLGGILCAPAIVRSGVLMPIKPLAPVGIDFSAQIRGLVCSHAWIYTECQGTECGEMLYLFNWNDRVWVPVPSDSDRAARLLADDRPIRVR